MNTLYDTVAPVVDRVANRLDVDFDSQTAVTLSLATSAAVLWLIVATGMLPMPGTGGMEMVMSNPGVPEQLGTHNGLSGVVTYVLMWGTMMSAMMYPAMIPFARRYATALDGSVLERTLATNTVFAAYSTVWTATGFVPLAVDALVDINGLVSGYGTPVTALAFAGAGAYQLTNVKRSSLETCCATVERHFATLPSAVRTGLEHGLSCVKCTWPLFALMTLVGSMNLFWMVALTLVVTAERLVPWNDDVAVVTGVLGLLGSVVVLLGGLPTFA